MNKEDRTKIWCKTFQKALEKRKKQATLDIFIMKLLKFYFLNNLPYLCKIEKLKYDNKRTNKTFSS